LLQTSSSDRTVEYFRFLLLTTAALSVVRFIGCCWFLGKTGIMCCFARR
jgi:chitin synthase